MDGSGAYTIHRPDEWVFAHTGLAEGNKFGGADTIVGYECDGCEFTLVRKTAAHGARRTRVSLFSARRRPSGIRTTPRYDAWQPGHRGHAVMGYISGVEPCLRLGPTTGHTAWLEGILPSSRLRGM